MSWSVVDPIERDQQGETKDFSQVRVLKNRTFLGFTGAKEEWVCDRLRYDHEAGRLYYFKVETQELFIDCASEELGIHCMKL